LGCGPTGEGVAWCNKLLGSFNLDYSTQVPPGQWEVPPGPQNSHYLMRVMASYGFIPSSQTLQISQNLMTGPRHDSYEPEGFAFPHFHPAHPVHPPHFLPAYPVHHMPPHFHQPELYGFAPRHPYEWHGSLAARGI